jgi:hypothetical protein
MMNMQIARARWLAGFGVLLLLRWRRGQWWRRQVRSGYGAMDVSTRFGERGLFVGQTRSARIWTIGWLFLVAAMGLILSILATRFPWPLMAIVIAAPLLQAARLGLRSRKRLGVRDSYLHGLLTMLAKWANLIGQFRYLRDRTAGRNTRLIEYKSAPASGT